jgi:histidinol-phosphate aminotransferase
MRFQVSQSIASIKPYEAGKPLKELERELNITRAVKLASNENALGFSPKVNDAVKNAMDQMNRYPESSGHDLNRAIAEKYRVDSNTIVLGNGSDDIIALLAHAYLNPGEEALMPLPSFLMYEISVKTAKGIPVMVPLDGPSTNLEGILSRISAQTKMIFITNPFNPTGSVITTDEFETFASQVPDDVIIVVDEAYIEFVRDNRVFNALDTPLKDPRIVALRTFSKAYGLAGFRVGYGIMTPEIAESLNRIRQPFNVNTLAQVAATAALADENFLSASIRATHDGLDYLSHALGTLGFDVWPTQANFMMFDVKTDSSQVFNALLEQGVIVRSMTSYGFDTFLRINAGTPEENKTFIRALKQVLNLG